MEPQDATMNETSGSEAISTRVQRIAKLARENPAMVLTTLAHHIDMAWMREAYARTRKDGAPGVDGQSAEEYARNLDGNLAALLERAKMTGRAHLIRFADDAVMVFANERDARRVLAVLPQRFGKYGLTLHPDKTRVVAFGRPPKRGPNERRDDRPEDDEGPGSFDMLGFTHHWAQSRKGNWVVKRKTAKDRLQRIIRKVYQWCRRRMHQPVREQSKGLSAILLGHYNYYGVTSNHRALKQVYQAAKKAWKHWLGRRSSRARMTWDKMERLLARYTLPLPRITRSYLPNAANP